MISIYFLRQFLFSIATKEKNKNEQIEVLSAGRISTSRLNNSKDLKMKKFITLSYERP